MAWKKLPSSSISSEGISTEVAEALDLKASTTALNLKANIASPVLTGDPTCPTQSTSNNSNSIASTGFVHNSKTYLKPGVLLSPYIQTGWTDNGSYAIPVYQAGVRIAVDFFINVSGPVGGVNGISPIFSFDDASPYDLRNLGVNMDSGHVVYYAGVGLGGTRIDVRFSQETPTRLIFDSRTSDGVYTVHFFRRVYARNVI